MDIFKIYMAQAVGKSLAFFLKVPVKRSNRQIPWFVRFFVLSPFRSSSIVVVFPGVHLLSIQHFESSFEVYWSRTTNVRKQVLLNSSYFTTILGGRADGRPAGWRN